MFFVFRNKTRIGNFSKEQEAVHFIMDKLQEDRHFKSVATYCLNEGADLLKEYTQDDLVTPTKNQIDEDASGASQQGSGKSFAPTPFSTTPRLGPQTWVKDVSKEEDEGKDKK